MSEPINLGKDKPIFIKDEDLSFHCKTCYGDNYTKVIGQLEVNGTSHDVRRCDKCKRAETGAQGGIKALLDEAVGKYGTNNVSYQLAQIAQTQAQQNASQQTLVNNQSHSWSLSGITESSALGYGYNNGLGGQKFNPQPPELSYGDKELLRDIASKIDSGNSNLYTLHAILDAVNKLCNKVEEMAKQNVSLIEKLATDPLNGMRKAVSSFNLE